MGRSAAQQLVAPSQPSTAASAALSAACSALDKAAILLVLDDKNALAHAAPVIAVEHGQLDVHEHKIGVFRSRPGDALSAVHGLDHRIPGRGELIAQNGAQILLIFGDKNAFHYAAPLAVAARTGSSMRNVEP